MLEETRRGARKFRQSGPHTTPPGAFFPHRRIGGSTGLAIGWRPERLGAAETSLRVRVRGEDSGNRNAPRAVSSRMNTLELVLHSGSGSFLDTLRFFWDQAGPEMLVGAAFGVAASLVRAWAIRFDQPVELKLATTL